MFGFGKGKSNIKVEFFRSGEGRPFIVSDVPVEQLPETFAVDTRLHLGDADWTVVRAQPVSKTEFRKSGRLQVFVALVETVQLDAGGILFSVATLSDDFPAMAEVASMDGVAVFHEDDWRQVEFVAGDKADLIEAEMTDIRAIIAEAGDGAGFARLHVRKRIPRPLDSVAFTVDELKQRFGVKNQYRGVGFNIGVGVMKGGFGFVTAAGVTLWGQADAAERVEVLNFGPREDGGIGDEAVLSAFIGAYGVCLVSWEAADMRAPGG